MLTCFFSIAFSAGALLFSSEIAAQVPAQVNGECGLSVQFEGDEQAIAEVTSQLKKHNVAIQRQKDCTALSVNVRSVESGYCLRITLPEITETAAETAAYERTVAHAETVAILIDAYLQRAPFVIQSPPRETSPKIDQSTAPVARPLSETPKAQGNMFDETKVRSAAPVRRGRIFKVSVFPEVAYAVDKKVWFGADFSGCLKIGILCVGPSIRFARNALDGGGNEQFDIHRSLLNTTLTIDVFVGDGAFVLCPGLGAGAGWVFIEETDPADHVHHVYTGVRIDGYVLGTVAVTDRWSMEFGMSAGVSFPAEESINTSYGADISEPRAMFRFGFGASYKFGGGILQNENLGRRGAGG